MMRMLADRRGQDFLEWFPRMMMLAVAVVIIFALVNYYTHRDIDAAQLEMSARAYRIYYDGNLFVYADANTGRSYPGVIDISRFSEQRLAAFFADADLLNPEARIATCVTLAYDDGPAAPRVACNDKATYERYLPFAQAGIVGPQSATMLNLTFPVTIRDGGKNAPGTMHILSVRRNS